MSPFRASMLSLAILAGGITAMWAIDSLDPHRARTCEVTWYKAKDHTVAANPRHQIPDGAYIKFTNLDTAPARVVIVRKRGHMSPKAVADFDLAPEAFQQLAPLSDGRLKRVEWQVVFP